MISKIISLDLFLITSVEGMFPTMYTDVPKNVFFLQVVSCGPASLWRQNNLRRLGRMACSFEKGSLGRDMPSVGMLVGLLLALTW